MKICCRCHLQKEITDFYVCPTRKDGHRSECKECTKEKVNSFSKTPKGVESRRNYRAKPGVKEGLNAAQKRYMQTEKGKQYRLKYGRKYEKTPKCIAYRESKEYQGILAEWKKTHAEHKKIKDKEYRERRRKENIEEVRYYFRNYISERSKTDIEFHIAIVLRNRIRTAIKQSSSTRTCKSKELLGCSIEDARHYLESLWGDGMSWDNYGYGMDKWNIDHIKPCIAFNLKDPEEQKKCFHYTNLQPLWQSDNFSKNSFYNGEMIRKKK